MSTVFKWFGCVNFGKKSALSSHLVYLQIFFQHLQFAFSAPRQLLLLKPRRMSLCWWGGWWWGVWGDARGHGSGWNHEWWTADDIQNLGWYSAHWKHWYSTSQWGRKYNWRKALLSILYIGHFSHFRAFPHQRKSCLFTQIFCHAQNFINAVVCRDLTNFGRSGQIFRIRRQNFSRAA